MSLWKSANLLRGSALKGVSRTTVRNSSAGHEHANMDLWRKLSFFVALPVVALASVNTYIKHQEEHHKPRPEFIPYDYLRVRTKRFPWGDGNHGFFHNPQKNALPDGYEE